MISDKVIYCLNFSFWKKLFICRFLSEYKCVFFNTKQFLKFVQRSKSEKFTQKFSVLCWASKLARDKELADLLYGYRDQNLISLYLAEDAFIRSQGLGSDFYYPYSLVIDSRGIYYDPRYQSDLECIFSSIRSMQMLDPVKYQSLRDRALNLQSVIVDGRVSKYQSSRHPRIIPVINTVHKIEPNRKIIFIPFQVSDDASVIFGGCGYTNLSLLREVRRSDPDAFIFCKIHPDVVSSNRINGDAENYESIEDLSDLVVFDEYSALDCIQAADEIHTISSLAGFEGLLRNKKVVCYGMPFYAGYGLTQDISVLNNNPVAVSAHKRRKELSPDILDFIIGALILYPTYYDWISEKISTPEDVIQHLTHQEHSKQNRFCFRLSRITAIFRKYGRKGK